MWLSLLAAAVLAGELVTLVPPALEVPALVTDAALLEDGSVVVVVQAREEGGTPAVEGVWRWAGSRREAFQLRVPGRWWGVAARPGGGFVLLARGGGSLSEHAADGHLLAERPLPVRAGKVCRQGSALVLFRLPGFGDGPCLWREQGGRWKPWALAPVPATTLEGLAKSNMLLFAANERVVGVVRLFEPRELVLYDTDGRPLDALPLAQVVAGVAHEAPIRALALGEREAYVLCRLDENERHVALWRVALGGGQLHRTDAPEGASAVVAARGQVLVLDDRLGVWQKGEE